MGTFYCSSCNKPIKNIHHRCGFEDTLNCRIYDPGQSTGAASSRSSLGHGYESNVFESDIGCSIGEDGLSGIPGNNGYYAKGISL